MKNFHLRATNFSLSLVSTCIVKDFKSFAVNHIISQTNKVIKRIIANRHINCYACIHPNQLFQKTFIFDSRRFCYKFYRKPIFAFSTRELLKVKSRVMWRKLIFEPDQLNPHFKVDDWMKIPTLLLRFNGMCHAKYSQWLPDSLSFLSPLLNYFVFFFILFGFVHVIGLFSWQIYVHESDKVDNVISTAFSQIIIYSFALYAFVHFQVKRKDYLKLCEFMNKNFRHRSVHGVTFITAERVYFYAVRLSSVWTFSCVYATLQWIFAPIFLENLDFPMMLEYPFIDKTVRDLTK